MPDHDQAAPASDLDSPDRATAGELDSLKGVWRTLGPAGWLAIVAATLPGISGLLIAGYMLTISRFLRDQGDQGILIYTGVFALAAGLAMLPTWVQSALGGFAFGVARGIPAALTGFVLGSIIGYEIARRASGDRLVAAMNRNPKLRAVRQALIADRDDRRFWKTFAVVTLLRLPPNSPFALTNLALASVGVRRLPYLLGTAVGMAPRTVVAVLIGNGVAKSMVLTDGQEPEFAVPRWFWFAGMITMLAVLAILGTVANRAIARVTGTNGASTPAQAP
ncbi:MAG: TVP38/TMEM64 family protein [Phycisphaerales bacterium]